MKMNASATLAKIVTILGYSSLKDTLEAELGYELALSKEEGFEDFSDDVSKIISDYNINKINLNGVVAQLDLLSKEQSEQFQKSIESDAGYQ